MSAILLDYKFDHGTTVSLTVALCFNILLNTIMIVFHLEQTVGGRLKTLADSITTQSLGDLYRRVHDHYAQEVLRSVMQRQELLSDELTSSPPDIVTNELIRIGEEYSTRLQEFIQSGTLTLSSEDRLKACSKAVRNSSGTIDAISADTDKWHSHSRNVDHYWTAHQDAIRNNVTIRRIFILDDDILLPAAKSKKTEEIHDLLSNIKKQHSQKIHVRVVQRFELRAKCQNAGMAAPFRNVLIVDGEKNTSFLSVSDGGSQHTGKIYRSKHTDIKRYADDFSALWELVEECRLDRYDRIEEYIRTTKV